MTMKKEPTTQAVPQDLRWAMVYHHGLPVATCPVEEVTDERLTLICGPLCFEHNASLSVSLSRARDGSSLDESFQYSGEIESADAQRLSIRVKESSR